LEDSARTDRERLVTNEQTKLTALFLNGAGLTFVAVGVFGAGYGLVGDGVARHGNAIFVIAAFAIAIGAGIHETARRTLAGLK
jgi:hypothetical protein